MSEERILRATFEDVLTAQEDLREFLDELAEDNRFLNPDERQKYIQLLGRATLGFGVDKEIAQEWYVDTIPREVHFNSLWRLAIKMAYADVDQPPIDDKSKEELDIEPGEIWPRLRADLLYVFPEALRNAVQISPERDASGSAGKHETWGEM